MKRFAPHQEARCDEGVGTPWTALAGDADDGIDDDVEALIEIWRERYGYTRDEAMEGSARPLPLARASNPAARAAMSRGSHRTPRRVLAR